MSGDDLTVVILREIRDEIRSTRIDLGSRIDAINADLGSRIDVTNQRLDVTNQRLDLTNQRLVVVADNIIKLTTQQIMTGRYVKNDSTRHDEAIEDLRHRVDALEILP